MADRIRVLIVDDIPETRDHLTKLLGFESDIEVVGAAASGAEALELAATLNPDIVLMDINMPGMDGIAYPQLSSRLPQVSIVMMSVRVRPTTCAAPCWPAREFPSSPSAPTA
jgi:pilus assembly protein CpaE